MELHLLLKKSENVTHEDISKIAHAIEKVGYEVEILPSAIQPQVIVVRK